MHKFLLIMFMNLATQGAAFEKIKGTSGSDLYAKAIAQFLYPWAMTFVTEDLLLIATKPGKLWLVTKEGKKWQVAGVPKLIVAGQGGLGDVVAHPNFDQNKFVYLSLVQSPDNGATRSAVVIRGKLALSDTPTLTELKKIWRQMPARRGAGHFSHKIAFGPKGSDHEGKFFITSGDRQEKMVAQRWDLALGKIIRLNDDGTLPKDNPFQDRGELAKSFWTLGHRNALGIAFDANNICGQMKWAPNMEMNLIS
jgi:glucose/arabinose dehydrogenase